MRMRGNGCEWMGMAENVRIAFSPLPQGLSKKKLFIYFEKKKNE
jgi:hypothetical protein